MPFNFKPEEYEVKPSPAHISVAHMSHSWNAVWRIAINRRNKAAALAEARSMIKEKLRWEREEKAKKQEDCRTVGFAAWQLSRVEVKE